MLDDKDDVLQSEYDDADTTELDVVEDEYAEPDDDDADEDGDDEPDSESAPDSDPEHEEKAGDKLPPKAKDKIQERFNKLTRERAEAERKAKAAEERLRELEERALLAEKPEIPELPDFDEVTEKEYAAALKRRDEAIGARLQWEQRVNASKQERETQTQQQALQRQQELANTAKVYNERAKALRVNPEELKQAAAVIGQVGLNDEIAAHILQDELGALITRHLGNNVQDLLEISAMSPLKAALYIEKRIKPKLNAQKRKSSATKPPNRVKGGVPDSGGKYPLTRGRVRFE